MNLAITYTVPASGQKKTFIRICGVWYQKGKKRPLPICELTKKLDRLAEGEQS